MNRLGLSLVILLFNSLSALAETALTNPYCLVEPDEPALPEYAVTYLGTTYHFCCSSCVSMFEEEPETYLAEIIVQSERSSWQRRFDRVWNAGVKTPGLIIGGSMMVLLLSVRLIVRSSRRVLGMRVFIGLLILALGAEAFYAHWRQRVDALIHQVHFATFHDYGHPPVPERPDLPPRLQATFYRGNDERSSMLFNRGYYRTADFHLDLCDAQGNSQTHGDQVSMKDLFLRIRVVRAPGTPDFFWKPERMADIFISRSANKLLGRHGRPVKDAVPMTAIRPMWEWEALYPLASFVKSSDPNKVGGIVYHFEKRYKRGKQIGSRFHYAYQFDLELSPENSSILPSSDLWMGALYRNRALRIWEIPADEWLSIKPIPVIQGENTTKDPKLLGIEGHLLDKN